MALVMLLAIIVANLEGTDVPNSVTGPAEVRDGDSLVIGKHRVRLYGIDAPEREQNCQKNNQRWTCGRAAQRHLARIIGNHDVECTVIKRDRFDRLLARCRAGRRDLNRQMIRDGMAVRFGKEYQEEERQARRDKDGVWNSKFQKPRQWRLENGRR